MNQSKKWTFVAAFIVVACLVAFPFVVPSGAMLIEAERWYVDHTDGFETEQGEMLFDFDDKEEDLEEGSGEGAGGSMDASAWVPAQGEAKTLPTDFSVGNEPDANNYTQSGYEDSSLWVEMNTKEIDGVVYHVAHVKIAHASQLRTALAGPFGTTKTNKPSTMAKNNFAIVAINGDYYSQRDGGYIVRQGETYRKKLQKNLANLLIDEKGDFHIVKGGDKEKMEAVLTGESPIVNSFTFGPALVIDGVVQEMPEKYLFNIHRPEPRAAIGQIGPLEYVLVAVDGRSDTSDGATAAELAEYMKGLGCQQAFNLDGGNSATLIFNNDYYNLKTKNAERSVSDIIYFASAE